VPLKTVTAVEVYKNLIFRKSVVVKRIMNWLSVECVILSLLGPDVTASLMSLFI
jgi:hypothetical protein